MAYLGSSGLASTGKYIHPPTGSTTMTGILANDRRQFYIKPDTFKEIYPDVAPFYTWASGRNVLTGLKDPLFKLFEHRFYINQYFTVASVAGATIADADTGVVCSTVSGIVGLSSAPDKSWLGLEIEFWNTDESTRYGVGFISDYDGSDIKVKPLAPGAALSLPGTALKCHVVGNAFGEGTGAPDSWSDELNVVWGTTQEFKKSVEITKKLLKASLRGASNELQRLQALKAKEHKMQMERAFLFGDSILGTGMTASTPGSYGATTTFSDAFRTDKDGNPTRTMMGFYPAVKRYGSSTKTNDKQNIFEFQYTNFSYGDFIDMMEKIYVKSGKTGNMIAFCGPTAFSYWSKLEQSSGIAANSGWAVKLYNNEKSPLGFNIRKLETPYGTMDLVPTLSLAGRYKNVMLIPDESNISHVIYEQPQFLTNILTDNAPTKVKHVYQNDEGVGYNLIETHNVIEFSN